MTTDILANRPLPTWYDDAKFGIMVHWGPSAVAGWAPRSGPVWDVPDHFRDNPYVEWYANSLKIEGSPVRQRHDRVYGPDYPYERFAQTFNENLATWNPGNWASLFAKAGARYVVPVTKHHDGFLLWPSEHRNPKAPAGYVASRDIVGELGAAVRSQGMRYGVYYSGGIDWLWHDVTIRHFADIGAAVPRDEWYVNYAFAHWEELIRRYQPVALWNDIYMPGSAERVEELFRHYLEQVPEGIINDRFKPRMKDGEMISTIHHDVVTPEYQPVSEIRTKKWEAVRGIGFSFGYNEQEGDDDYEKPDSLIQTFVDIVSKGGNLLLNVGPRGDGTIPDLQVGRLEAVGGWLRRNGEAIYGTRPWTRAEGATGDARAVRFTTRDRTLFATVFGAPAHAETALLDVPEPMGPVRLLGGSSVQHTWEGGQLRFNATPVFGETAAWVLAYDVAVSP